MNQKSLFWTVLLAMSIGAHARAQEKPVTGDAAAVREGQSLFRANCSPCHGMNAQGGGRGPDLTSGRWVHGSSDQAIFNTISHGVAGTEMPANSFEDSETWAIVAYLRSLAPAKVSNTPGDRTRGQLLFTGKAGCAGCHMVQGHGGLLGPDLSRVGEARSVPYLIEAIREPSRELSSGMLDPNNHYGLPLVYDTVTVVTASGRKIVGVAKNEDTYSIQLLDTHQELQLLQKKDLLSVTHERRSLMPAYSEQVLPADSLHDLIAYLVSLRGEDH